MVMTPGRLGSIKVISTRGLSFLIALSFYQSGEERFLIPERESGEKEFQDAAPVPLLILDNGGII